jgi:hypothetical protein
VGGHHSEHLLPRRERSNQRQEVDLPETVRLLRGIGTDEQIARMLNRTGIRTARGASWTAPRVAALRAQHRIASFHPQEKQRCGILTQDEAAARLGISAMSVHRLLRCGVLPGRQARPGLPWVIEAKSLALDAVQAAVRAIRQPGTSTPVDNPDQPTLW